MSDAVIGKPPGVNPAASVSDSPAKEKPTPDSDCPVNTGASQDQCAVDHIGDAVPFERDMEGEWNEYDRGTSKPKSASGLTAKQEEILAHPPMAGSGVNPWLYRVARQLHWNHTPEEIKSILYRATSGCGRDVRRCIERAIRNSKDKAWQPRNGVYVPTGSPGYGTDFQASTPAPAYIPPQRAWPERDKEKIDSTVREGRWLYDLWEYSPIRLDSDERFTELIIDCLFPGNPLICAGISQKRFWTRPRDVWRGKMSRAALIVPSPMTKVKGLTQEGRLSEHTLEATGPRKFLVIEFDFSILARDGVKETEWAPLIRGWEAAGITVADACSALLLYLEQFAPLALVVSSGGKSLQGWFPCKDRTEDQLRKFMRHAHKVGADHVTWCKSQFIRMPDGTRDNGARQTVYYFAPEVL
jgi:hypothetical protein